MMTLKRVKSKKGVFWQGVQGRFKNSQEEFHPTRLPALDAL